MQKTSLFIFLLLLTTLLRAQSNVDCLEWKSSDVIQLHKPAFSEQNSVDNKPYSTAALLNDAPSAETLQTKSWNALHITSDSVIASVSKAHQFVAIEGFIKSNAYTKATLSVTSNGFFEVYLDGEKVKSHTSAKAGTVKTDLTLATGNHQLLIRMLSAEEQLAFGASITTSKDNTAQLSWSTNGERGLNIHDILDGKYIQSARISPSGKYLIIKQGEVLKGTGKKQNSMQIYDVAKQKMVYAFPKSSLSSAQWLPTKDKVSYLVKTGDYSSIYTYDVLSGANQLLAEGIKDLGKITWSPNEDYLIFSRTQKADKPGDLKRVFGNEDRLPYFRTRSFLYKLDLSTGAVQQLTAGYLSTNLHDIKADGSAILFSTNRMDYTEVPFTKQSLFEMNLQTMQLDTIWKDKLYDGYAKYSPDGTQLMVSGSPETFGSLGVDVSNHHQPNSFDGQLYIFNLKSHQTEAITKDFDPSVNAAYWTSANDIYFTAGDKDEVKLFRYDIKNKAFKAFDLPVEVLRSIDIDKKGSMAVFYGSSITTPEKLYTLNLKNSQTHMVLYPKVKAYENLTLGTTERWYFVNKNGINITGSVYYPKNYDANNKYPVIVYYYGGTVPTARSFGGRYPKNIWAENGYMVYVLQPSGATGFGQSFSALHVNGWGTDAIDDIIDGTQKFLQAHPAADADNVGCIGASYGGFTTMMLQTRTDIFKTAIAHAGISDITSYWGEGYWGYSYSTCAAKNSYPWSRKDIYIDNSPLFNADKFQNSILLLHGTSDTNVPVGESLQLYAALKILNKDVEMVLIDGEDHHILDYQKRIQWHNTIMAWFDKMLKNQPQQWKEMYPDKNL